MCPRVGCSVVDPDPELFPGSVDSGSGSGIICSGTGFSKILDLSNVGL